ncbi:hypothetical protein PtB15_5B890 [Puccinia triticina]|nr:hypothetical protein PtB15_5B890 [Puccinia triticina]
MYSPFTILGGASSPFTIPAVPSQSLLYRGAWHSRGAYPAGMPWRSKYGS